MLRPFGAETPHRGVSGTPLTQNRMRDYDPTTGRYLQADPLGLVDGASVYGYALGNPGRYVDPLGLQTIVQICGSVAQIPSAIHLVNPVW